MAVQITDTIVQTDTREEGVREVYALHDKGHAATLYGSGPFLAIDLDAPYVDVFDAIYDLLGDDERAEGEAMRLIKRGF